MRLSLALTLACLGGAATLAACADCSDRDVPTIGLPGVAADTSPRAPEPTPPIGDDASPPPSEEDVEDAWIELAPEGAGFTVETPVALDHEIEVVTTPTGVAAEVHQYTTSGERSAERLAVVVSPLFLRAPDARDARSALEQLASVESGAGGRALAARDLLLDGFPGKELVTELDEDAGGGVATWRIYVAGRRLFQVVAIANNDAQAERAERFVGSFRLTPDAAEGAEDPSLPRDLWRPFTSPEGDFTVQLPVNSALRREAASTPWGRREVGTLSAVGAGPGAVYTVVVTPLTEAEAASSVGALLEAWQAHVLTAQAKPLELERRLTVSVGGRSGRVLEVKSTQPDHDASARYLGVAIGERFYELGFMPLDDAAGPREASRFFDSFRPAEP